MMTRGSDCGSPSSALSCPDLTSLYTVLLSWSQNTNRNTQKQDVEIYRNAQKYTETYRNTQKHTEIQLPNLTSLYTALLSWSPIGRHNTNANGNTQKQKREIHRNKMWKYTETEVYSCQVISLWYFSWRTFPVCDGAVTCFYNPLSFLFYNSYWFVLSFL